MLFQKTQLPRQLKILKLLKTVPMVAMMAMITAGMTAGMAAAETGIVDMDTAAAVTGRE